MSRRIHMRGVKREIAACVATLETLYDQIPEMITHQVQIYLAKLIDQQRKFLPLLNSIDEDKTAPERQMKKQLGDLRAIQGNLLRKFALRSIWANPRRVGVDHGFQMLGQ